MKYDWGAQLMWLVGKEVGDLINLTTLAKLGEKMEIIPKHQEKNNPAIKSWSYNFSTKTSKVDIAVSGEFGTGFKGKDKRIKIDFSDSIEGKERFFLNYYVSQTDTPYNEWYILSSIAACDGHYCSQDEGYYFIDGIIDSDEKEGRVSIQYYDQESIELSKSIYSEVGVDKDNKLGLYPFEQLGILPDASVTIPVESREQMLEELSNIALQRKSYLDSLLGINGAKTNSPQYVKTPNTNPSAPTE